MYPYFQKNQKPNPSNSSKLSVREASPADPLRQFLAENPAFGTLLFQVTGGNQCVVCRKNICAVSRLYQKCGLQRDLPHMARSRNSREYLRTDYLCAEPHI